MSALIDVIRQYLRPVGSNKILELPQEVIGFVCRHLSSKDLRSFRSTCKKLHGDTLHPYAERFFTHIVVFLHPASLNQLLDIATDEAFSKHVEKLTITTDRIALQEKPTKVTKAPDVVRMLADMQMSMENNSMDYRMLARAIKNLPKLQQISTTNKSIEHYKWRSRASFPSTVCGRRILSTEDSLRYLIHAPKHTTNPPQERANSILLAALARNPTRNISVALAFHTHSNPSLGPHSPLNHPSQHEAAAHRIRKLTLHEMGDTGFCNVLASAPNLEKLRLSPVFPTTAWPLYQPDGRLHLHTHLRQLKLDLILFASDTPFIAFLQAHANTLEHVALYVGHIYHGTWRGVFETLYRMPKLNRVSLYWLWGDQIRPTTADDFKKYRVEPEGERDPRFREEYMYGVGALRKPDRGRVLGMLGVLLGDLRTFEGARGGCYVDFRKVWAFMRGEL